jgi:hypothetical protein
VISACAAALAAFVTATIPTVAEPAGPPAPADGDQPAEDDAAPSPMALA